MLIQVYESRISEPYYRYNSSIVPRVGECIAIEVGNEYHFTKPIQGIEHVVVDGEIKFIRVHACQNDIKYGLSYGYYK